MTHDDAIWYLEFSPDGKYVLSGGADNNILVWESSTGKEVTRITSENGFSSATFRPNGKYVLWTSHKTIQQYLWHTDDLIIDACARITRNLTRAEWVQFIDDAIPDQAVCENLPIEPEVIATPGQ